MLPSAVAIFFREVIGKFKKFDKNGDKKLNRAELKKVAEAMGDGMEVQDILDKYDKDGDECLNLNEFYKLATDKNTGPIPE